MDQYEIVVAASARKELRDLSRQIQDRIVPAVDGLSGDPRPPGVRKLQTAHSTFCMRVGDYRIIYEVDDRARQVRIVHIRHRSDAYR